VGVVVYTRRDADYVTSASAKLIMPCAVNLQAKDNTIMGDKSPKSTQKKQGQKSAAKSSAQQKKHQAAASSAKPKK
jgi:hypothetical protein